MVIRMWGGSISIGVGGALRFGRGRIWSDRCIGDLYVNYARGIGISADLILPNFSWECHCPRWDCEFRDDDRLDMIGNTFFFVKRTTVDWFLSCDNGAPGGRVCHGADRFWGLSLGLGRFLIEWRIRNVRHR